MKFVLLALFLLPTIGAARTYHVDAARGTPSGSGLSWSEALSDLESLFHQVSFRDGDILLLAGGTYELGECLRVQTDLTIRGGFLPGGGSVPPGVYPTRIARKAGHGLLLQHLGGKLTLSDLVLTESDQGGLQCEGSGDLSAVRVSFIGLRSAVQIQEDAAGLFVFEDCLFLNNYGRQGAALNLNGAQGNVLLSRCRFLKQWAWEHGGAISQTRGVLEIANTLFHHNHALRDGSVLSTSGGECLFLNCTLTHNSGSQPGARTLAFSSGMAPQVINSVIHGEGEDSRPSLRSGSRNNLITATKLVFDHAAGTDGVLGTLDDDFRLTYEPQVRDQGSQQSYRLRLSPGGEAGTEDLAGLPRVMGERPRLDIGAYEGRPLRYVDPARRIVEDGTSWDTAWRSLNVALEKSPPFACIQIGEGIYRPPNTGRRSTFHLPEGIEVIGGFGGTDGDRPFSDRDPKRYRVTLSGDFRANDTTQEGTRTDNAIHVVSGRNLSSRTRLEGLTFEGGAAPGGEGEGSEDGGGMFLKNCSLRVTDCHFHENQAQDRGGAVHLEGGAPSFIGCSFRENRANLGAGVSIESSEAIFKKCHLEDNDARLQGGGFFARGTAKIVFQKSVFGGNRSLGAGGAVFVTDQAAQTVFDRCLITGNETSGQGGGGFLAGRGIFLFGCEISGNLASEGGGFFLRGDSHLLHTSLTGNRSLRRGGALTLAKGIHRIQRSVIWYNQADKQVETNSFHVEQVAEPTFKMNLLENQGGDLPQFDESPKPTLAPFRKGGFRLQPGTAGTQASSRAVMAHWKDRTGENWIKEGEVNWGALASRDSTLRNLPESHEPDQRRAWLAGQTWGRITIAELRTLPGATAFSYRQRLGLSPAIIQENLSLHGGSFTEVTKAQVLRRVPVNSLQEEFTVIFPTPTATPSAGFWRVLPAVDRR